MRALRWGGALGAVPAQAAWRAGRLSEEYAQRFSFCCSVDLCRSRKTPPSFRFLGRKAWLGAVVVLVAAMRQEATATRQLTELFGVSRRTVRRWRTWWGSAFAASPFWKLAAAAFMPPVDRSRLPASLLERFAGDAAARPGPAAGAAAGGLRRRARGGRGPRVAFFLADQGGRGDPPGRRGTAAP